MSSSHALSRIYKPHITYLHLLLFTAGIPCYLTLLRIIIISALQCIWKDEGMLAQHTSGKALHLLKKDGLHKTAQELHQPFMHSASQA